MNLNLSPKKLLTKNGVSIVTPFVLITACFALWGFANDMTGPIVKAFSKIFRLSVTGSVMVQVVFHLGYFAMAFPAAMYIQRRSFKGGVMVGLVLFAFGSLLFLPAKMIGAYVPFLLAYFIMTCGLSFLETSSNTYIYCMGDEQTAICRLNLAQAFNPIGALVGMWIAMHFIQAELHPMSAEDRMGLNEMQYEQLKSHDLGLIIMPYLLIALCCALLIFFIRRHMMPREEKPQQQKTLGKALSELFHMPNYREGVLALFFYTGAQVCCWTFILQYGTRVFMLEGMAEKAAEMTAQKYNIVAMLFFCVSRFVCTFLMYYVKSSRLLASLAIIAVALLVGVIFFPDRNGLYCLVAISACMSLMFPTIYGISLRGVGDNVKFAGAGLIMAIIGGSVFPPLQAMIIDSKFSIAGLSSVNISFLVPMLCFCVIALYGHRAYVRYYIKNTISISTHHSQEHEPQE